jgi:ribosomal protein L37AE/L43A
MERSRGLFTLIRIASRIVHHGVRLLRDAPPRCPRCDSTEHRPLARHLGFVVYSCRKCSAQFTIRPQP